MAPFESLKDKEKQEWREGYDLYAERMRTLSRKPRPFNIWITDFGFTHK